MKNFLGNGRILVGAAAASLLMFTATTATAAEEEFDASIEIIANLAIDEITELDFGTVGKPTAGEAEITLEPGGAVGVDGGDGAFVVDGSAIPGVYEIRGQDEQIVNLTATVGSDFGAAGVSLTGLILSDDAPQLDGDGFATVTLGGTVTVDEGADEGTFTAQIDMTASYQ
jgi:hypothetical protein